MPLPIKTVVTPDELYQAYDNPTFYKLLNAKENHHGIQYHTGLCTDTNEFDPSGECSSGGLYFFERSQLVHFTEYVSDVKYIRQVTFPPGAKIYVEDGKFKADKFILGEREEFYIFEDLILETITYHGKALEFVKE